MAQPRRLPILAAALAMAAGAAGAQPTPGVVPIPIPAIYDMETLRTGPLPDEFVKQLGPLHTLPDVENFLKANRVAFAWSRSQVRSTGLPPDFVRQIDALPPHEVFVTAQGAGWLMGVVLAKH
ncbi:hypothetical protein [Phenylobacterium sp.]|jgi:hypothetical protein|uniref:hypothetical protein n=1 Tax=Phenylobacterium sp. TaxID=1871053 RepID=UPI002E36416E|nr:hypothetical protein [Phenylobacterium sp.]HEX3366757.1 hypothetical protein [Phenylobacterium sp.]